VDGLLRYRIILVAGKGGVGRTVVTAALAKVGAASGKRVLVADLEEPSSQGRSPLALLFGCDVLTNQPRPLEAGIDGVIIQAEYGTELFLQRIFRARSLVALAMRSRSLRRLLQAAPSFHEMGVFFHMLSVATERSADGRPRYDLVLVDMPSTGHTLALTGLPDILLRLIPTGPIAAAVREGEAVFQDRRTTAACVVTLPETLPISESLELIEGLVETRIPVGGVLVNRVPNDPFGPEERLALRDLVKDERLLGQRGLDRIVQSRDSMERLRRFVDVPIDTLPELELEGMSLVDSLAAAIVGKGEGR